ncbi:MAG: DUF2961 domain-containing protein [Pirellulales bacterium]|nr:DUF2961 domain-containing protein [Pirellulales bacterium]
MTKKHFIWCLILAGVAAGSSLALERPTEYVQPPEPEPVPPPRRTLETFNPLQELARSQDYSAARASSYQRQGGPRDNTWIPTTGEETTLADIRGPGAITHIWTTHRGEGRDLIIRIYWDGSPHPSVEVPIGDLFGVAMGINAPANAAPVQASSEGRARNCWWHMPFNRSARITATAPHSENNQSRATVPLYFYIDYRTYAEPIEDLNYFHARFLEADPPERGKPVTLVEAEGDGHFVGIVMGHRCRMDGWFGEGDDIITVDGTVSFLGTGTEDYFCDAWGFRVFSSPYHGCAFLEGRNAGDRLSVYRFHILDPIPFRKSFKFQIEHWPWISSLPNTGRGYYSSAGFWYQKTIHKAWPRLEEILSNAPWDPDKGRWNVQGSLEAEELRIVSFRGPAGPPKIQKSLLNLSGDHLLLFNAGGNGEFSLEVPGEEEGSAAVTFYFGRAADYGIVEIRVNGKRIGDPIDTFLKKEDLTRQVWPPRAYRFPDVPLKKGINTFQFSVQAKNPESEGFMIGLDCLVIEPKGP